MIAIYAWSNMMILNAINIAENFYKDEKVDLFIRTAPGISREMLRLCRTNKIFNRIVYCEQPRIHSGGGLLSRFSVIKRRKQYANHYERLLSNNCVDGIYDSFFSAGFWNDSLFYLDFFYKKNNKIRVCFYDEGGATYDNNKRALSTYYCNKRIARLKDRVKRFFPEKIYEIKYRKNVSDDIYVYQPDRYRKIDPKMHTIELPKINSDNPKVFGIITGIRNMQENSQLVYQRKRVYYIVNPRTNYMPDADEQNYNIIGKIMEICNNSQLLIKTHPNMTLNREEFGLDFEDKVFVDRQTALLEAIYINDYISNKIIITYASTSAMFAKAVFDKEPYVIITYRLFHQYHENGDIWSDAYAEAFKEAYDDKTKVYVPNTMDEFTDMLKDAIYKSMSTEWN